MTGLGEWEGERPMTLVSGMCVLVVEDTYRRVTETFGLFRFPVSAAPVDSRL